jgi:hypothetical protein
MIPRPVVLASALLLASTARPSTARAQPKDAPDAAPAPSGSAQRALELYTEGRGLLSSGKAADALPKLAESLSLLPSPNTELLIAHAHRELGHAVLAIRTYAHVAEIARAEVAKGQDKYKGSLGEAERWQKELTKSVGTIIVKGPPGLEVDIRSTTGADSVHARVGEEVWVEPGDVIVRATSGGRSDAQQVSVAKGAAQLVTFAEKTGGPDVVRPPPPAPEPDGHGPVVSIPGIIVGSVGLAALGVSAGFGGAALALHGDLEGCQAGDPCAATFEDDKATGETFKTITNVTLGAGLGLVAVGATIWIIQAATDDGPAEPAKASFGGAPMLDASGRPAAGFVVFGGF